MAAEEQKEGASKKPGRRKLLIGIGAVAVIIAAVILIRNIGHEKTDNAQIDGHIIPVRASVGGYVDRVLFSDNQRVRRGDTLAMVRSDDYGARVAQAEGALASAKASLEAARSGFSTADLNAQASSFNSLATRESITSAETRLWKAQQDRARVLGMAKDDAATPQQVDAINAEVAVAQAQLAMARKQSEASQAQAGGSRSQAKAQQAQVALAEALITQREAELELARINLGHTAITAPCDGVVSKKAVEPGQFISAGTPVCAAVDAHDIWVTANFKETQLARMRPGQPVKVKVDAYPDLALTGHISSLGGATGARFSLLPPDNATGNFVKVTQRLSVRIDIDLPKDTTVLLAPGLSAVVDVNTKG